MASKVESERLMQMLLKVMPAISKLEASQLVQRVIGKVLGWGFQDLLSGFSAGTTRDREITRMLANPNLANIAQEVEVITRKYYRDHGVGEITELSAEQQKELDNLIAELISKGLSELSQDKQNMCQTCGKVAKLYCSGCKKVYYCNVGCQRAGWFRHKKVCQHAPNNNRGVNA